MENELNVSRDRFIALGLDPTTLTEGLLEEIRDIANKYSYRADTTKIIARSVWNQGMETSPDLVGYEPIEAPRRLSDGACDPGTLRA